MEFCQLSMKLQAKNEEFFDVISDNLQKVNWKNIINQRQTKRAEIASMIKFIRFLWKTFIRIRRIF